MRWLYSYILRPLLFRLDAETAHGVAALFLRAMHTSRALRWLFAKPSPAASLGTRALGLTFRSPVGVAAGFDKGAQLYNGLGALGFGSVEIGTLTAQPQAGNPKPRLFRLRADRAVINRMGFNNPGSAAAAESVRAHRPEDVILGVNLGKTKTTALEDAADDYAESARRIATLADYLVINVSSPNTPGLRSLQSVDSLRPIVAAVQRVLSELPKAPPLLVKIAPDLADEDIDAVTDLAIEMALAGVIATNTTIARDGLGLQTPADVVASVGAGGLSGAPLRSRSLQVIRRVYQRARGRLTIIGVGGIENAEHAWEAMRAGAALVQVYTGMIYVGPDIAADINAGLAARLAAEKIANVADIVGADYPQ